MTLSGIKKSAKIAATLSLLLAFAAAVFPQEETTRAGLPRSAASDVPEPGVKRAPLKPELSSGLTIARIFYDLTGTAGSETSDRQARAEIEKALGIDTGDAFDEVAVELALTRVRRLASVRSAGYALYPSASDRQVVLVISAALGTAEKGGNKGVFAGQAGDFPVLWKGERAFLKLQVNGGLGLYGDINPWFGNAAAFTAGSPIADDPPGRGLTTWGEASIETGLHGAAQLGLAPLYAYGAVSWFTTLAVGNDLFRSDARAVTRLEKAYVGVLYKPAKGNVSANFSLGRQNFQLNEGFLISQFSGGANAGPLPGLYLNPRTAFEKTFLGKVKIGKFSAEGFFLDPEELDFVESRTAYRGLNLQYNTKKDWFGGFVYYDVPRSRTSFPNPRTGTRVPREGLRTINTRVGTRTLFGVTGLETMGEYARQWNPGNNVGANAGYASLGYTFYQYKWRPSVTYRFAHFSGDDPQTAKYERFDAPLSSGLDNWVQGVNFKKVVTNSNLNSHRVRFNIAPQERVSYTFDYFYLYAPVKTAGGNRFYGQEVNGAVRWVINKRLFFLGVTGIGVPGAAVKERAAVGGTRNWVTLQASLFWNL